MFRKLGAVLRWLGVRLLVAVAVWAVVYTSLNYYLTSRRDRALGWFAANGIPMSPAKFDKPQVAPQDDAGPLWRAAAELAKADLKVQLGSVLESAALEDGRWISTYSEDSQEVARPLTPQELDRLRKVLAENHEVFDLLHRAALRPKHASPIDYSLGMGATIPHTMEANTLARLLRLAADVAAYDGHLDQTIEYWTSLRALQRENIDEPILVCQLVAGATQARLSESVQQALRSGKFNDDELKQAAALLKPYRDYHDQFRRAMQGEACFDEVFFSGILEGWTHDYFGPSPRGAAGLARLVWLADETAALGLWRRLLESATPEALPSQVFRLKKDSLPWYALMSRIMMPALDRVADSMAKNEATRLVTLWSVALQRQKLATGSYPERLADLRPEFTQGLGEPTDPFTGQPLVYKPLMREGREAGFLIYSVGPNMADDGGRNDKDAGGAADDVAFTLEP